MKKNTIRIMVICIFISLFTLKLYSQTHPAINAYDSYLGAIGNAQKLDDLNPFISKRKIEVYSKMTPEKKISTLKFKKQIVKFTKRKSINAQTEGDNITLHVDIVDESTNNPAKVEVNVVKENNEWKVDKEKYKF
ncbi:MAG TPA: hypothetical protein VLB82_03495 [Thermodesulfobacteriota bacterium]|nr:hypothetical protein [Thermodesulfobacteriota bacterium]